MCGTGHHASCKHRAIPLRGLFALTHVDTSNSRRVGISLIQWAFGDNTFVQVWDTELPMFPTSKFAISPAGPIPYPPPCRKVLGRSHSTSLNLACARGAATCILPWFEISKPDFLNLLVSKVFVSMGASEARLPSWRR